MPHPAKRIATLTGAILVLGAAAVGLGVGAEVRAQTRVALREGRWLINDRPTNPGSTAEGLLTLSGRGWDRQAQGDDLLNLARCEGVMIADLTFADCRSCGIKVEAENAPRDIHIYHCRFRDIGVRAIKGSAGKDPNLRAIKGSVRYGHFENTKIPPSDWLFGGDYIAAIDMMALEDWTFSDNVFRNIRGRNGGGRAAIFIWVRSTGVIVERNLIVHCDRGVAFGNPGQSTANMAGQRLVYVADSVIRNNFIAGGPDCGIELWYADRIKVLLNTIWRPDGNEVMKHAIVIEKSETGYGAYVPDLPGCIAVGETIEETEDLIREAIEFHLQGLRADGVRIPDATSRADYVEVA